MGTSNFRPNDDSDFPLIVLDYDHLLCKKCPKCHLEQDENNTECENCGEDLTDVESETSDSLVEDAVSEMERWADKMNDADGKFYEVKVMSGYYSGVQFYVEDDYEDISDMSEEESLDLFGMYSDEAVKAQEKAKETIIKMLNQAKDELGLYSLGVTGRFSNGETLYHRVDEKDEDNTAWCDDCAMDSEYDSHGNCTQCGKHIKHVMKNGKCVYCGGEEDSTLVKEDIGGQKTFRVNYSFYLSNAIDVEADTEEEAEQKVQDMIDAGEIGNLNEM